MLADWNTNDIVNNREIPNLSCLTCYAHLFQIDEVVIVDPESCSSGLDCVRADRAGLRGRIVFYRGAGRC